MNSPFSVVIEPLAWTLAHLLWQGTLIAIVLVAALRFQRKATAAIRYTTACAALASMMFLIPAQFARSLHLPAPVSTVITVPAAELSRSMPSSPVETITNEPYAAIRATVSTAPFPENAAASETPPLLQLRKKFASLITDHAGLLTGFWATGALLFSLRLLVGLGQLHTLKRSSWLCDGAQIEEMFVRLSAALGVRGPVRIFVTPEVTTALTYGWRRPVVLLPLSAVSGMPASHLEAILAHELAHIRRHDYAVNLMQSIIEALLFYHPAVWWVSSVVHRERENCCDDLAAQTSTGGPSVLARALAGLEDLRQSAPTPALASSGGDLLARVRRLAGRNNATRHSDVRSVAGLTCIMLILVGTFSLPALTPEPQGTASVLIQRSLPTPDAAPVAIEEPPDEERREVTTVPQIKLTPKPTERPPNLKFTVIIAESLEHRQSRSLEDTLVRDGFTPVTLKEDDPGRFSVRMGQFDTNEQAESLMSALRHASYLPIRVEATRTEPGQGYALRRFTTNTPPPPLAPPPAGGLREPIFHVVVASDLETDKATQLERQLQNEGFRPVIRKAGTSGRFSVSLGHSQTHREAENLVKVLHSAGYSKVRSELHRYEAQPMKSFPLVPDLTRYTISAFHTGNQKAAEEFVAQLARDGYTGRVVEHAGEFHVIVGQFANRQEAEQLIKALKAEGYKQPELIIEYGQSDAVSPLPRSPAPLPTPKSNLRVFDLNPSRRVEGELEGRRMAMPGLINDLQRHLALVSGPVEDRSQGRRFWYDPETLLLTISGDEKHLKAAESYLQRQGVQRFLRGDAPGPESRIIELKPTEVARLGPFAVRYEPTVGGSQEKGVEPAVELLGRLPDTAQSWPLRKYESAALGGWSVEVMEIVPETAESTATVRLLLTGIGGEN